MQFFKIMGELCGNEVNEQDRGRRREVAHGISLKTAEFNEGSSTKYCFVSGIGDDIVTFGVITTQCANLVDLVGKYAKSLGLDVKLSFPDEITFATMQNLLGNADSNSFIEDDGEVLERFGLDRIMGRRGRGIEFGENLVNFNATREEIFDSAKKLCISETMIPELERIYKGSKSLKAHGHPVHYIVETDDREARKGIYRTLLDALYVNIRLNSARYTFLDFRPGEGFSKVCYEALYKVSEGGTVVVRYLASEDGDEDGSSNEQDTIDNICEMAKKYRNKVLTVLCFPRECKKVKAQFYESLGNMSFVEIREDFLGDEAAKAFLSERAKDNHVKTDKRLFEKLSVGQTYLAAELREMFDEWYDKKLKTSVYPQYKDIACARKDVIKAKPQGSAYDELDEMIGLSEAKSVIKKAINYYKMQKLYEEKGVKRDNPAMHMIFSGNPGTAKTTVARLFARIMRENGLLSNGQLVEVGRGDLVGRYVGWTAQAVQAKFRAAVGGVLFIDEAYSLVDDRDGSYGDEAINTIVQEMENRRSDVVVIFAGYPDKMEAFLRKNPGLRSRIAFHVPFADYSTDDLCKIADIISKKNGMRIDEGALSKLERVFDVARVYEDFGNGRYVRNIFEQAKMNQATRLLEKDFDAITDDDVITITEDDIIIPEEKKFAKKQIGFF